MSSTQGNRHWSWVLPLIVSLTVTLLGFGVSYGVLRQEVAGQGERIVALEGERVELRRFMLSTEGKLGALQQDISWIRAQLERESRSTASP